MKAELAQRWKKGANRGRHCGTALGLPTLRAMVPRAW
jgi:hypothetical protein